MKLNLDIVCHRRSKNAIAWGL